MRRETCAVGHRDAGASKRSFERSLDVAMAGEPQSTAFGVSHAELLDGWRDVALRWLTSH